MKNYDCKCLEIKITKTEKIYIELTAPCDVTLREMFPKSKVVYHTPNISYQIHDKSILFYVDSISESVEQDNFWDIMFVIEEYIENKYPNLILHGGAIAHNEKAIAFIQSRKKGKSTLLRALLSNDMYDYISDDLLLLQKGKIAGVASPIRVRDKLEEIFVSNGKYVGDMLDETGELRSIFVPYNSRKEGFIDLSAIILPCYTYQGMNCIQELRGANKFLCVLENLKQYRTVQNVYDQIIDLCSKVPVYSLEYSDIEYARDEIYRLWETNE